MNDIFFLGFHIKLKSMPTFFVLYCLVTVCFTLYYSWNYTRFARYKGDEYIFYLGFIIGITYLFFFFLHFVIAKINIANVLFAPLLILFLGLAIRVAAFFITSLEGTPGQEFYLYTSMHLLLSFLFIRLLWRKYFKEVR